MSKKTQRHANPKNRSLLRRVPALVGAKIAGFWRVGFWHKVLMIIMVITLLFTGGMYSVAQWYIYQNRDKPLVVGATFIPYYAESFGLDPKETLQALIDDMGIKRFRLVSYWNQGEETRNVYDFRDLDWQFDMIEEAGGEVSLALGLRQPRWPECHMPTWAEKLPKSEWEPALKDYIAATVNRYKDRDALKSYQLENEFFLEVFGECPDFTRQRLIEEYELVKSLDPNRTLIVSRSNNALGLPYNEPIPDRSAVSVYKRVWDKSLSKRYFEYPFPAWFYASLAGGGKLLNDTDLTIHELQTEAWLPVGYDMNDPANIPEQEKSLNAERLKHRIRYGEDTGIREIYLWGVEWWYWQKTLGKPDLWNTAKTELQRIRQENQRL
ncbi:MAG: hypothetical protein U5L95_04280 [Candidatus Saccharibacteria bacterium]|nr:hypothetical protein [Candidatus Saccharibacteria bacterium]